MLTQLLLQPLPGAEPCSHPQSSFLLLPVGQIRPLQRREEMAAFQQGQGRTPPHVSSTPYVPPDVIPEMQTNSRWIRS